jgi:hypothetical protein
MKPTPLISPLSNSRLRAFLSINLCALLLFAVGKVRAQQQLPVTEVGERRVVPTVEPEAMTGPMPENLAPGAFNPAFTSGRTLPIINDIGTTYSASQGVFTQADIRDKPLFRTTEFLEQIPGLIVTNETNGVDANTLFLRGFNIDHGTDFAFFFEGVPLNLGSNPHAQGYTDMQFVISELVSNVDYGKGPYYAKVGNFSSVGYSDIHYFDVMPYGIAKVEAGQYDWFRTVVANSGCVGPGTLLYGFQFNSFDNSFSVPEHLNKTTGVLRYTLAGDDDKLTFTALMYNGQGTSEPVIPLRLVESGAIGRFTNVSPTDYIIADRFLTNAVWQHHWGDGALTLANVYATYFTLSLKENPVGTVINPDGSFSSGQIDQRDHRWETGFNLSHTWKSKLLGDQTANTVGVQLRHDQIPQDDIFATTDGQFTSIASSTGLEETDLGLFYQNETKWGEKVRTVLGLRGEVFHAGVSNNLFPENSGTKTTEMFLPKGSLVLGPWSHTEFYVNGGYSFHSDNAGGAIANIDETTGGLAVKTPLLVQARGAEVGFRSQQIRNLTTSFALWQLHLGSELVFDPIAETTVPLRSSDRYGTEWINTYHLNDWFTLNADYTWSHGRLLGFDPTTPGQHIPQAVTTTFSGGPSLTFRNGLFANLRYRYWGPRYLIEDASASSRATNLFELSTGYQCTRYTVNLQILNLFNNNGHDIDFAGSTFYPQFGDTAPSGGNDLIFKPQQPFQARISFTLRW